MEHETEIQASKFSKMANGKLVSSKIGNDSHHHYPDEGDADGDLHRGLTGGSTTAIVGSSFLEMGEVGGGGAVGSNRLRDWQHSSRIIRVSRASGGKDRHSKVLTAKGPRDRRVRLSVSTAIQFYDLQDRLGVDQPSKAVEWLIKAASDAISELPSLNSPFPETPRQQISDDRSPGLGGNGNDEQGFDSSAELELDGDLGFVQAQKQHGSNFSKSSACSCTSETSRGSRTEIRVKAREWARERTAKDKERDQPEEHQDQQQQQREVNNQQLPQSSSSFTQLLTFGIGNMNNPGVSSSPMNYFSTTGASSSGRGASTHHSSYGVSGQIIQLGNPGMHQPMMTVSPFSLGGHQNPHELQHFPFIPDHHLIVTGPSAGSGGAPGSGGDDYNLSFSISPSSGLAAFNNNRGTLQSNSLSSLLPQFQRFPSSQLDGSTLPFFLGTAVENQHHQHQHQNHHPNAGQFPSELQLCYGDNGGALSDQKVKGKT